MYTARVMSLSVERDQTINPSEVRLSKIEADKQAFALMASFKAKLYSLDHFKEAASDVILNITGDQSKNVDKPRKGIKFEINNSGYRVDYSFSGNEQSLLIVRKTLGDPIHRYTDDPELKKTIDVITLKSRRFTDQKPIRSPEVKWYRSVGNWVSELGMTVPRPQSNTAFAVDQALKMLAGLTPQAPQR